ncbi:site-specific DNA-methyltransferase [Planktothrix agardhii]|uniref:site-specific DNA-methyltransferase n=1 Tax=Planktothrix agardhii TaxID=1160 RepID=UPI001F2202A0|nr:site-specific DNA-methyltransferase [Planktothrix agardhii]MCF3578537.1 site-specific DNA-methyltransferase [Planktothrix agardhii 1812]MCF3583299.1 site-specific DNA-methyltransferase [Planktothrix agardhii 1811]
MPKGKRSQQQQEPKNYDYSGSQHPLRPDIGVEPQFKKKKPPATYRYDSSLSPALDWDDNPAREQAESLIAEILEAEDLETAKVAAKKLKALSQPFLNWTGKAERLSFDVPSLPLFVHERLSTRAIIETLKSHKTGGHQLVLDLFSDPQWSITDQILKAYEYQDKWVNRMILGDSLVVMNSLVQYEGMGGKVQMIYIDPPYGVKFGSNFQPFVRKQTVTHNQDDDFTREPEMVQAYRDTWELGLHSYLTYLRDRLLLARELLTDSGSVFVQISDENVHHIRELMDEVFGEENFVSQINFQTTSGFETNTIATLGDFLLWYSKNKQNLKVKKLFQEQKTIPGKGNARWLLFPNGSYRGVSAAEKRGESVIPEGVRFYKPGDLSSQGVAKEKQPFEFQGKVYFPPSNSHWKANYPEGMNKLAQANRIHVASNSIQYRRFADDFPYQQIGNIWTDTLTGSFTDEKLYIVQTNIKVIERCLLMTTDPGDLVLDLTCGSGTTGYVAEQWGRRWITCDVSRVPLALARQRLLTATFPYYELKDESKGPSGGFVYKRKQNNKGEEVGGIVPHITLKSIANNEPPDEEILVDRPEQINSITRVCGPFVVEGIIPPPVNMEGQEEPETEAIEPDSAASFTDRMLEVLRKSPVLHLPNNKTVTFTNVRQPARTQILSAEALIKPSDLGDVTLGEAVNEVVELNQNLLPLSQKPVAFFFGSENGAIAERTLYEAAKEAKAKQYHHLYVIGFAITANARQFVEHCQETTDIPATYIQATPDILMGDLLKNMRSSQIFSVCGLPEIKIHKTDEGRYQVELLGLDVFDPTTMDVDHQQGKNVPAWFLDTDYNGLSFHVNQAFFPRTSAWDSIKKALKGTYEDSVWEHLAGTLSTEFDAGEHKQVAVKVIDDRGNELLVVKLLQ